MAEETTTNPTPAPEPSLQTASDAAASLAYFDASTPAPLSLKAPPPENATTPDAPEEEPAADAEDDVPELEAEPAPDTTTPDDDLDDELFDIAAQLGIDETELRERSNGSAAAAERILRRAALRREVTAEKRSEEDDLGDYAYPLKVDDDDMDEPARKHLAGLNKHYARAMKQARSENRALAATVKAQQERIAKLGATLSAQAFDGLIAARGEELAPILGSGPSYTLKKDSKYFKNRDVLFGKYSKLLQTSGNPLEAFDDAVLTVFKGQKPLKEKKTDPPPASIPRPTARSKATTPADRARERELAEARKIRAAFAGSWDDGSNGQ